MKTITSALKLVASIALCELAGLVGSIFTTPSIDIWFKTLVKPEFAPPNSVFAPVWTILFALMGVSLFFVWQYGPNRKDVKNAIQIFMAQLMMNVLWSILFFGLHSPRSALIEIFSLWLMIIATMFVFYKISRTAAYLLLPYFFWVSFAMYLNYFFWVLN